MGVTASQLDRIMACAASAELPQDHRPVGEAAIRGTEIHLYMANKISPVTGYQLPLNGEWMTLIDFSPVFDLFSRGMMSEHAFWYRPGTRQVKQLGRVLDRNYGLPPADRCIAMTTDVYGQTGVSTVTVLDLKTGTSHKAAKDSWQLRVNALAARDATNCHNATVIHGVLVDEVVTVTDRYEYSGHELDEWDKVLAAKMAEIEEGDCEPVRGSQCTWCPCYAHCPTTGSLVRTIAGDLVTEGPTELTTEIAAGAWIKVAQYQKMLDAAKEQLEDYARQYPFQLPDGKVVREVIESREYCGRAALQAVSEIVGVQGALGAAKTDKKSLEAVIRADAMFKGEDPKVAVKATMSLLREAGAFETRTYKTVKAVK